MASSDAYKAILNGNEIDRWVIGLGEHEEDTHAIPNPQRNGLGVLRSDRSGKERHSEQQSVCPRVVDIWNHDEDTKQADDDRDTKPQHPQHVTAGNGAHALRSQQ